jgi:dihydrofolate synthase/folylpolyglutamate synthase
MDMRESEIRYQEALDYLYSFIDYSLTRQERYAAANFDLGRVEELLKGLGDPQDKFPVIHVAGTKGKGSTAALVANSLKCCGYRVGLYTSPHLHDYCERMQINGVSISHEDFTALLAEVRPQVERVQRLTTFEITTAMAFVWFAANHVDSAVVEVGLGGRLDATNVVDPLVSVITSVSYDHMAILGDSLSAIAGEKAGIIKAGRPVIISPQREEARKVLYEVAKEREAPLTEVGVDYHYAGISRSLRSQRLMVWRQSDQPKMDLLLQGEPLADWQPRELETPLLGDHQIENCATAVATLELVRQMGWAISDEGIAEGFRTVNWPGRFEVLREDPPLIVDSAHNEDSAMRLRIAIDDYLGDMPLILLFGVSEDKDIRRIYEALLPRAQFVITSESIHPRAANAQDLAALARQFGKQALAVAPVELALQKALDMAGDRMAIVTCGSLFLAAAVRETWQKGTLPVEEGYEGKSVG